MLHRHTCKRCRVILEAFCGLMPESNISCATPAVIVTLNLAVISLQVNDALLFKYHFGLFFLLFMPMIVVPKVVRFLTR